MPSGSGWRCRNHRIPEVIHLMLPAQSRQTATHLGEKIAHPKRLLQDPAIDGADSFCAVDGTSRDIDDLDVRTHDFRLTGQVEPIHAGHPDIGDQKVDQLSARTRTASYPS